MGCLKEGPVVGGRGVVGLRAVAGVINTLLSIEVRTRKARVEKMSMCLAVTFRDNS